MASFGVLSKKKIQDFILPQTGLLRSTLRPLDLGPGGGSYNEPISHLHHSYKLFLWPEKCKFECQEVDYLGLIILKDHIAMDPVKVQGVTDWPQPVKVKDVQSFIGFMNFYQRFIHNFSEIAHVCSPISQRTGHGEQLSSRPSMH